MLAVQSDGLSDGPEKSSEIARAGSDERNIADRQRIAGFIGFNGFGFVGFGCASDA